MESLPSPLPSLHASLLAHKAADADAVGWLVGVADEPDDAPCLPLYALRHDWRADPTPPPLLIPPGLHVVGVYAATDDASPHADQLPPLLAPHAAALSAALSPEARLRPLLAAVSAAAVRFYEASPLTARRLTLAAAAPSAADAALASFAASHLALRGRAALRLCAAGEASGEARGALARGAEELEAALAPGALAFVFPRARHLGVVRAAGVGAAPQGACGALLLRGAGGEEAEEEEEEEEEGGEEEEEGGGRGRPAKPRKAGRKGGRKGAPRKPRPKGGGGGGGGAPEAAARPAASPPPAAAAVPLVEAQLLWPQSSAAAASAAPHLRLHPPSPSSALCLPLALDVVCYVRAAAPLPAALAALAAAAAAQLRALAAALAAAPPPRAPLAALAALRAAGCLFLPPRLPLFLALPYALASAADAAEAAAAPTRRAAHLALGLPLDRPLLRSTHALGAAAAPLPFPQLLRDVAAGLPPPALPGGRVSTVRGSYEYYHYMQRTGHGTEGSARYDDSGWGCAYRSLQSIISWYRLQGYTAFPNPTHYEIQLLLVEKAAQDRGALLGKKQWIGSQEISWFLAEALGVTCKTRWFASGEEVVGSGRALAHHFETQGTPVMIGGGQLAFTLLGVEFSEQTGETRFLIMDPHYTGADDLELIRPKWVGWKSADSKTHLGTSLFHKDVAYNLCFPQLPTTCF